MNLRAGSSCMKKPKQKAKNQKPDKSEQEFYKRNKHLVDFAMAAPQSLHLTNIIETRVDSRQAEKGA